MRFFVRKEDTARFLLAIYGTLRHHDPAKPWQSPAMEGWYTPDFFEYDTAHGIIKLVRYDVDTPRPIARGSVPDNANVVIATTAKGEALLSSIPYLWTATIPPKPVTKVSVDVIQSSLFGDEYENGTR